MMNMDGDDNFWEIESEQSTLLFVECFERGRGNMIHKNSNRLERSNSTKWVIFCPIYDHKNTLLLLISVPRVFWKSNKMPKKAVVWDKPASVRKLVGHAFDNFVIVYNIVYKNDITSKR